MKNYQNRERVHKVLGQIENKFLKGYKLTVEQLVEDYFAPKNQFGYLMAKSKMRGWLQVIKKDIFNKTGHAFGNIDKGGVYGVPTTEGEGSFYMKMYYKKQKGLNANAIKGFKDLSDKKILPKLTEEKVKLLKVINGVKK
jgi:hypothetical protein